MVLYFDTNVFGRLLEGSQADERRLFAWKHNGSRSVVLSVLNLQEVMAAEARNPDLFRRLVRTVLHWCERDRFVKPIDLLLKDDIDSYARGGSAASPYISGAMLETVQSGMDAFLSDRSTGGALERLETVLQTYALNRQFTETIAAVLPELREAAEREKVQGVKQSHERFFRESAETFAASFARKCNVYKDCEARGLAGLLELKSVFSLAGILISTIYSFALESRNVSRGDMTDLQHFTLASASADLFVTEENSLSYRIARIPGGHVSTQTTRDMLANCPN
jgi:hypothetical protein